MKYKKAQELAQGLRELADFVEERGHTLPIDNLDVTVHDWVWDDQYYSKRETKLDAREKMRLIAKALGNAEKVYQGDYFDLRKKFGPVRLEFTVNRSKVCERVVVGTKEIPERILEAHTKEIVEWVCTDPILAPTTNGEK